MIERAAASARASRPFPGPIRRTAPRLIVSNPYVDDADLVERARLGDQSAFGELATRYQDVAVRMALAVLGSRTEADDVAQEALLVAYRKLQTFRGEASFKTWLLSIVRRRALNRRRGLGHRLRVWLDPSDVRWSQAALPATDQEDAMIDRELRGQVRRLIGTLPPRLRDALLLVNSGYYTVQEAAAVLGVPAGTVKARAASARQVLWQKLARLGYANR